MITDKIVAQWHAAVRAEHAKLGAAKDGEATKPYGVKNAGQRFADLRALTVVENHLVAHGFADLHLEGYRLLSSYGPLVIRLFVEHHPKEIVMTAVGQGTDGNIEVAAFAVTVEDDKPVLRELLFDVAKLVLPKVG